MIFVTVGTQLPFDRLIEAVDTWAGQQDDPPRVFAQTGGGKYVPKHLEAAGYLTPPEYTQRFQEASLIIGHAGMGTILKAMEMGKPVVVMPRLSVMNEHRSDHQIDTARHMQRLKSVTVAWSEVDLIRCLDEQSVKAHDETISPYASEELLDGLRGFVRSARPVKAKPSAELRSARRTAALLSLRRWLSVPSLPLRREIKSST